MNTLPTAICSSLFSKYFHFKMDWHVLCIESFPLPNNENRSIYQTAAKPGKRIAYVNQMNIDQGRRKIKRHSTIDMVFFLPTVIYVGSFWTYTVYPYGLSYFVVFVTVGYCIYHLHHSTTQSIHLYTVCFCAWEWPSSQPARYHEE